MERALKLLAVAVASLAVAVGGLTAALVYMDRTPPATPSAAATLADFVALCSRGANGYRTLRVEQDSMRPTLELNQIVLLAPLDRAPKRGDIVAFLPRGGSPETTPAWIRRVIGVGGDTIAIRGGVVSVNDIALNEPHASGLTIANGELDSWSVQDGSFFVMGDNRNNSTDSRSPTVGSIPVEWLVGRLVYRCAPADQAGPL